MMDSKKAPVQQLAEDILRNATVLTEFLQTNSYPEPSFSRDAPTSTLPIGAPQEIQIMRQSLMEASLKVFQLAAGPSEYLPNLAVGYQYLACLRWLNHFNIFALVPLHGAVQYKTVASLAKVPEHQLKSIARMAMTSGLFQECCPHCISHSATSALFVTKPEFALWAGFMCESSAPTAAHLVEATEKWPGSLEKNKAAYNVAFETDLPFFKHLSGLPKRTEQFAGYMKSVTKSEGTDVKHLLAGFDWEKLEEATIVDVGGSSGHASIALASAYPRLKFNVQDLLKNVADGAEALKSQPESIASRITFQVHDFFEEQPVKGADLYLLRMILHDWADKEATVILTNLIPALVSGARLLIMDTVLPSSGQIPVVQERLLRVRDLTMMQAFNSKERDVEDWTALLAGADKRLKLKNTVQPFGSMMAIMEVVFDGAETENIKVNGH